ncbi:Peptide chain release factor 1 [Spirochaeta thermophila DSM 6578]|uniref:Peptide chain release factor 1 n=1 Tax=Winmispira thermophila (strain ATCC 700085 / DSM 6578 / Z-1203) TaxID=869211 RepID=G0GDV2_WINT7|nr:peptide chain release factor 1 [Spirochaeta thermophila]AEJ62232.1 Peptide chain release factor 1 [Spirochaeta thermophila DSM 6578]
MIPERRIEELTTRFKELETALADPSVFNDQKRYRELAQEHAHLSQVVRTAEHYRRLEARLEEAKTVLEEEDDHELKEMAREEIKALEGEIARTEQRLKLLLVPPDPLDGKNIILEIRAGTGGEEAALFAADLYRMYARYAERKGWKMEIMEASETELGGFRELVCAISGKEVYGHLRFESGGHRVQRIPVTESGGRIHTSAVTVAVLPEPEETEVEIRPEDIRVDVFRSSGPGGQSVNTTDSAVRITHLPTGLVVSCQDEKSQHKNKAKALKILRARLYEMEKQRQESERAAMRRSQIGSGDRSERIRTYNFPQNRVTDHRINLTLYKLEAVMDGDLDEIIDALRLAVQEEALSTMT